MSQPLDPYTLRVCAKAARKKIERVKQRRIQGAIRQGMEEVLESFAQLMERKADEIEQDTDEG